MERPTSAEDFLDPARGFLQRSSGFSSLPVVNLAPFLEKARRFCRAQRCGRIIPMRYANQQLM